MFLVLYTVHGSKISFTPKVADFAQIIYETSDWLTAFNKGKVFNLWSLVGGFNIT